MSVSTLLRDVAECRAWEMRLHRGSEETRKAAALPGWPEWVAPLMMPLFGWYAWGTGFTDSAEWYAAFIPWYLILNRGRLFPPSLPTEWEALALPSRRSWLLARWSHRAPALLWLGACTLALLLFTSLRDMPHSGGVRWPLAAVYLLSPFLVAAVVPWFAVKSREFEASPLPPLLGLLIVVLFAGASVFAFLARASKGDKALLTSGVFAVLAVLALLPTLPALRTLRRSGLGPRGWRGWASWTTTLVLGLAGTTSLMALGLSLVLAERGLLRSGGGDELLWLQWALTMPAVGVTALMAGDALRRLPCVDLEMRVRTAPAKRTLRAGESAGSSLAGMRAGGGLRSAAWSRYRGSWRFLRYPWLSGPALALWECRALAYGFIAVIFLAWGHESWGRVGNLIGGGLLLVCPLLLPAPMELPESRRLHLLGAEFEDVVRHNRRWGLLLAALPVFIGGTFVFRIPDYTLRMERPLLWGALLGCTAATLLFKCGALVHLGAAADRVGRRWTLFTVGALFTFWLVSPPLALSVIGPALFLASLAWVLGDIADPAPAAAEMAADAVDD